MKNFITTAIRTDEYEIYIDENIWNDEALKTWGEVFHEVDSVEEIVKHLAFSLMRFGSGSFIEGFGYVKTFRKDGSQHKIFGAGFKEIPEDEYAKGISAKIIVEDDDYDFELR
jgi:hypothetical protein